MEAKEKENNMITIKNPGFAPNSVWDLFKDDIIAFSEGTGDIISARKAVHSYAFNIWGHAAFFMKESDHPEDAGQVRYWNQLLIEVGAHHPDNIPANLK